MSKSLDGSSVADLTLRNSLPLQIRERVRLAKPGQVAGTGCVVYWMRLALRGHENPALDAAILAANALDAPLVVVLQIEDQYPQATARRQMFLLQGARCAQEELIQRGVSTIVQVDRERHRSEIVHDLAQSGALIITEEPFCVPWLAGVERLQKGKFECPVWLVDCSSVVPSALVPKSSCHRAYMYEKTMSHLHHARISLPWTDAHLSVARLPKDVLAESLNLADADLVALVAEMDVDSSVKPTEHTIGGGFHGYKRWTSWIAAGGLKTYAKRRNDSLDVHGVSRMSAYLNAGMVSPLRIAREAAAANGAGKSKFLNEFLTWRGLTYAWCYHFPMPSSGCTLSQLPSWASETLRRHASDKRTCITRACLANACSGDRAWDGMQRYLVETGELHNNARMGWGCAIPKWTASPEDALSTLVDLNNSFALDGHAPPSYGGLLGCLGLFSGPKGESPVFGTVSARPPKAKYASMPSQIPVLMAELPADAAVAEERVCGSTEAQTNKTATPCRDLTLLQSFTRLKSKQIEENLVVEASSKAHVGPTAHDNNFSPAKRRWSNLKLHKDPAAVIEID